jgi:hypothetical protein
MPRDLPHHPPEIEAARRDIEAIVRKAAVERLGISDPDTLTKIIGHAAAELLASASPDATPRELTKSVEAHRRKLMLAQYDRLRPTKGHATAIIVAKQFARDPRDITEVESLAHYLRDHHRKR